MAAQELQWVDAQPRFVVRTCTDGFYVWDQLQERRRSRACVTVELAQKAAANWERSHRDGP